MEVKFNPNYTFLHQNWDAEFLILQGGTRCLHPDTLVHTTHGLMPIKKIEIGDIVYCEGANSEVTTSCVVNKFTNKVSHQCNKLIKFVLKDSTELISTYEHRHKTKTGYINANVIAERAMEICERNRPKVYGFEHGKDSNFSASFEDAIKRQGGDNKGGEVREGLFKNNAKDKWQNENNIYSQNSGTSLVRQPRKQATGEPHQQYAVGQQGGEFGVGNISREHRPYDEAGAADVQQGNKEWTGKDNRGNSFEYKGRIYSFCGWQKSPCGKIWLKRTSHKGYSAGQVLEAREISIENISEIHLLKYDGFVYDLEVAVHHNFLITPKAYITHNSGKSYSIYDFIIYMFKRYPNAGIELDAVRESMNVLTATILREFIERLNECGMYSEDKHNMSEKRIEINGNYFNYFSADTDLKVRGRKRDILWLNEPNPLKADIVRQLLFRTNCKTIIDFNPSDPVGSEHWLYDNVMKRPTARTIITTYKDNPHLPQRLIDEIEYYKDKDPEYYKVFGSGERASARIGQIFTAIRRLPALPIGNVFYGLDFGKTNDPTCLSRWVFDGGELIGEEVIYQTNLTSSEIVKLMKQNNVSTHSPIYADSAEPLMIRELKDAGFNVIAADKGKGSVSGGIDKLKSLNVYITEASVNAWREVSWYTWQIDKATGKPTGEPVDLHNHFWDSARYAIQHLPSTRKRLIFTAGNHAE